MTAYSTNLRHSYPVVLFVSGLAAFSPLIEGGTVQLPVFIIRLVLLGMLTAWLALSMKRGQIIVYKHPVFIPVIIFLGWAVVSVVRSPYTAASLQWLISILSYAMLLFLVLQLLGSEREVRWLIVTILVMGLFEAAVGVWQFFWKNQARATGTFFNPNFFATYEMAVFALAFGLLCYARWSEAAWWERLFVCFTAGMAGIAFVLAQSRGALLAIVVALGFVGCYRWGKAFLAVLLLGLTVGVIVPSPLQQRVLSVGLQDPYAYTRLEIWKNSLPRIVDHPWGAGMGLYKYLSFQYRFPVEGAIARYGKRAESAHNEYLEMAVDLGVPGLTIFLVGVGLLAWEIRNTLTLPLELEERGVVVGLSGGILGVLAHGGVDSVFHDPALVLQVILFVGLILVLKRLKESKTASDWAVPFPYHPVRLALVGICAILYSFLAVQPAAAWYAFEKGEAEMTAGKVEQALPWLYWAIRIDPGVSAYHDRMAFADVLLYHQSGDVQRLLQAVEELRVGLELNPLDTRFAHRLGTLYVLLAGRAGSGEQRTALLQQAATFYEQAIQLDPFSPFNYFELGKLRWAQGRAEEAQAWFRRATSFEPNFLPARVQLAELSLKIGQREVTALEFTEILKIKERYKGRVLNHLERQYLDVDHEPLKRSLGLATSS